MAVLAALVAGLLAGWAFARGRVEGRWRDAAAAAGLGAGLAALVAALAGDDPWAGAALGIAAGALIARQRRAGDQLAAPAGPAVALLVTLLLLRLGVALGGGLPLAPDEMQYWDWSRDLQAAYYSKPGLIAWLIAAWTAVAGDGLAALRLLGLALAVGAMALAWRTARLASGEATIAWYAVALVAVLPIHAIAAGLITTDVPLMLCWAGFLAVLMTTPAAGGQAAWWQPLALGLLLAVGLNAKYAMLYAVAAVGAAAVLPSVRAWLATPAPWIALAIGACGLLPILWWNAEHGWVGLLHVAGQGGAGKPFALRPERMLEYLGGQLAVGFPASLLLPWAVVWAWRRRSAAPAAWLLAAAALVPLAAMLVISLQAKVQPNWAALAWVPAAILVAWWLYVAGGPRLRAAAVAGVALALVAAVLAAAVPGVRARWPAIPPTVPERKLAGFDELAAAVDRQVQAQPERTVTLTGGYDLAAALAWHNRHLPRPVCANFGRRMNQYDMWERLDPDRVGWDAVFAMELDRDDVLEGDLLKRLPRRLAADFVSAGVPQVVRVERGGRTWRRFLVVRLAGFSGTLASAKEAVAW